MSKTETPVGIGSMEGLGLLPDRWYVVSVFGLATLCADEDDARRVERECNILYPRHAPHRAVLMGDVSAERERCAKLCETWMEPAERGSGAEAAGWLHQVAQHMRRLTSNDQVKARRQASP